MYLAASSWNGSVRCWKVDATRGLSQAISMTERGSPVLDCAWSRDGQSVFCAGVDKFVQQWDLATGNCKVVAGHEGAVKHCFDVAEMNYLATASWDKTLRYWDIRAPTGRPVGSVNLPERAYAMDVKHPLMVVGLAERKVVVYDVRKPAEVFQEKYSQLKYQTRCLATWPDSMGYVMGGVDGKISVDNVRQDKTGDDFTLLCHRDKQGAIYCINSVRFHKQTGYLATGGGDGWINFWDKDRGDRAVMRGLQKCKGPICDIDFSEDGSAIAYAVGYDWCGGATGHSQVDSCYIVLHGIQEGDIHVSKHSAFGSSRGRGRGGRRRDHRR